MVSELEEIVALAGLDETHWQVFTDRLHELVPGTAPLLCINDKMARTCDALIFSGVKEHNIRKHIEYYGALNPWTPFNFDRKLFELQRTEDTLPSSTFRETEYYQDFMRHVPNSDAVTAQKFWNGNDRDIELAVHYDSRFNEPINRVLEPVMRDLAVPMRTAFELLRINITEKHAQDRKCVLAHIAEPAFLISSGRRVLESNTLGESLAANGRLLRIGAHNRLDLHNERATHLFDRLTAKAVAGLQPSTGLERISVSDGDAEYVLTLHRIARNALGVLGCLSSAPPCVLLVIHRADRKPSATHDALRAHFNLTSAEARLAVLMARGVSLKDASESIGITYQTAKTQLRSIFSKLNVHRQAELVALLLPFVNLE